MSLNQILTTTLVPQNVKFNNETLTGSLTLDSGTALNNVICNASKALVPALPLYVQWPTAGTESINYYADVPLTTTQLVGTAAGGLNGYVNSIIVQTTATGGTLQMLASPDGGVTLLLISAISVSSVLNNTVTNNAIGFHLPPAWSIWLRSASSGTYRCTINIMYYPTTNILQPFIYRDALAIGNNVIYTVPSGYRAFLMSTGFYILSGSLRLGNTSGASTTVTGITRAYNGDWTIQSSVVIAGGAVNTNIYQPLGPLEPGDQIVITSTATKAADVCIIFGGLLLYPLAQYP